MFWKKQSPRPKTEEQWQLKQGVDFGRPIFTRFDLGANVLVGHRDFGIQIGVAVPFLAPDQDGLPSVEDSAALTIFEDRLIAIAGQNAILVGVITTNGMREFVLYTGTSDWIPGFHQALRDALPSHDVQAMAKTDPAWEVFLSFTK